MALVVDGASTTYRELEVLVRRAAAALAAAGVGPGDRVALVDLASRLSVATILAAARLGAATAQMNAYLTPGELGRLVGSVGARVGVAGAPFAGRLGEALDGPVLEEADVLAAEPAARPAPTWATGTTPPSSCSPAARPACPSRCRSATGWWPTGWPTGPSRSTRTRTRPST